MTRRFLFAGYRALLSCGAWAFLFLYALLGAVCAADAAPPTEDTLRAAFQNPPADCRAICGLPSPNSE